MKNSKNENPTTVESVVEAEVQETPKPKSPRAPKTKREQVSKKKILQELIENYPKMSKKRLKTLVDDVFATMVKKLEQSEEITISGFGRLTTIAKPAKVSRNPLTGEAINVPARTGVKFKALKTLKLKIN